MAFAGPAAYAERVAKIAADVGLDAILITSAYAPGLLGRLAEVLRPVPLVDITECDAQAGPPSIPAPAHDEPALIQYTSGSTSRPKAVVLTHENIAAGISSIAAETTYEGTAVGLWLPFFHDMGLFSMVTALTHGLPIWLWRPEDAIRRPMRWLAECARLPVTSMPAPDFFYRLLTEAAQQNGVPDGLDLSHWTWLITGSELVRPATAHAFERTFAPYGLRPGVLRPAYGLAEATLMATCSRYAAPINAVHADRRTLDRGQSVRLAEQSAAGTRTVVSCGPPVPDLRLRVADHDDQPLPEGTVGEIQIAGPAVTAGYLHLPESEQPFTADGWLRTGDLAFLHEGELYPSGRIKDMAVLHGRNFYAGDVEAAAAETPGVHGANSVAFVPDTTEEERMVLLWESSRPDSAHLVNEQIRARLVSELGLHAVDVFAVAPATIPLTSSGKVRRQEVRDRWQRRDVPVDLAEGARR